MSVSRGSRRRVRSPPDAPGRFHLAAHETNFLSQKNKILSEAECLEWAAIMELTVDILIISAFMPDYWPLLAGLTMAAVLALV
jgi:hypothetical protein